MINLAGLFMVNCMIKIEPIPAYSDNYIWCMYDEMTRKAVVVDPGDASPVKRFLATNKLELLAILITHHHFDHTGGVEALLDNRPVPVYGPCNASIVSITDQLKEGDQLKLLGVSFSVLSIPGHTLDHIAFYCADSSRGPVVFCGDTLFAGGCGRLFEGDPAMMLNSLNKLAALPANTGIYCAHEYTLSNLEFAKVVEPDNSELQKRMAIDKHKRQQNLPTVPSLLSLEKATNPFLRCDTVPVIESAVRINQQISTAPVEVFATIRNWKDNF